MKLALSLCFDFHSRTLWHTTLHTWSTFLIVKKAGRHHSAEGRKNTMHCFFHDLFKIFLSRTIDKSHPEFSGFFKIFVETSPIDIERISLILKIMWIISSWSLNKMENEK